ncbi:SDR family NAD(P)-dependent oxidoreductase [Geodermatophilus sp. FMUSA9-8]|uniref:SDR family NAD(P)-dependent oxidoreductase n=1 Tax=Geodermatophilus sp. FMUSA9-8 TaxID=3120155 RepID=UPI00300A5413
MTTTLITGAAKGLGMETAIQLAAAGHTVYVAARDLARARAVAAAIGGRPVQLDVTRDDSVAAAAAQVASETDSLDVLVNNAGISVPTPAAEVTATDLEQVYAVNVFGPVRVLHAFLPLLRASDDPLVVNVSSGLGSLRRTTDPEAMESGFTVPAYNSSKAALNMLTSQLAVAIPDVRQIAVTPSFTATDLNGHRGTDAPEHGVRAIVRAVTGEMAVPTGSFADSSGLIAW